MLPYRALTRDERSAYWDIARKMDSETAEEMVWKTTSAIGLEIVRRVANFGYRVSKPVGWGDKINGSGEFVSVYPLEYDSAIGKIDLWESGGFVAKPITVFSLPDSEPRGKLVGPEVPFRFADRLRVGGLDFQLYPDAVGLSAELTELDVRADYVRKCLNKCLAMTGVRNI